VQRSARPRLTAAAVAHALEEARNRKWGGNVAWLRTKAMLAEVE
jgi:hypothetical protein